MDFRHKVLYTAFGGIIMFGGLYRCHHLLPRDLFPTASRPAVDSNDLSKREISLSFPDIASVSWHALIARFPSVSFPSD